ncbi:MAG: TadE family protein [Propioniciclava sp.]
MNDSVQWAILSPVLLVTILGLIQVGIWLHGRSVASDAAIAGAEEAALLGSNHTAARQLAASIAADGGMKEVTVDVQVTATTVRMTVTGRMPTFVDLGQSRVSEGATRPLERITHP